MPHKVHEAAGEPLALSIELELETVAAALEPLTLVEKQAVWLETMLYSHAQTGVLLRMAPPTVEKIRDKGADLIRGKVDSWSRTLLAENGLSLGRAAAAAARSYRSRTSKRAGTIRARASLKIALAAS